MTDLSAMYDELYHQADAALNAFDAETRTRPDGTRYLTDKGKQIIPALESRQAAIEARLDARLAQQAVMERALAFAKAKLIKQGIDPSGCTLTMEEILTDQEIRGLDPDGLVT
jgi:hypothetical protein